MAALVVENGSNVANAATLATEAATLAYALARGKLFPSVEADQQKHLLMAMDYMNSLRARYQGVKTYETQTLQFPRTGMWIDGVEFSAILIPIEAIRAQMVLAIQSYAGVVLMPTSTGKFIVEDTVGPITTIYSEKVGVTAEPEIIEADAWLAPLFAQTGGFGLRSVRI